MGIFGTLLILIVGQLLSYIQKLNDQQYIQMKSFRNALNVAYNGTLEVDDEVYNTGSAVSHTEIEHRRHYQGDFFGKGERVVFTEPAYVYWAVPLINRATGDMISADTRHTYYINDYQYDLTPYYNNQATDQQNSNNGVDFDMLYKEEYKQKQITEETPSVQSSSYELTIKDQININFTDPETGELLPESDVQYLVREDGQYKYKSGISDLSRVEKKTHWQTFKD